jgi:polysaccharide export outer membrane protein
VLLVAGLGCFHTQPHGGCAEGPQAITVPPPGTVPVELAKVTLPPYVIEAPDNLLIQVFTKAEIPFDEAAKGPLVTPIPEEKPKVEDPNKPKIEVQRQLPVQDISGQFQVRPDGSVGLGFWGSVTVSGLTLDQAAEMIRRHLLAAPGLQRYKIAEKNLIVIVDVLAYNSKQYYVILDGGGYGEQVYRFPITGSETVMDAVANVYGLQQVASKRNIWVARRTLHPDQPWQILPVDWVGITQHGISLTNYQVMPGDRIYVKAQKLVTIDTAIARVISPIERVFGVTLLGTSMINQIRNRNTNGNGNGTGF